MKKQCPSCECKIDGQAIRFSLIDNYKYHKPLFAVICPHCHLRLRRSRIPWCMFVSGWFILMLDGLLVVTLATFSRDFMRQHPAEMQMVVWAAFLIGMTLQLWGAISMRYEIAEERVGRLSHQEKFWAIAGLVLMLLIFICSFIP